MRLFAAVDPPADVAADLTRALGARDEALRWVPSDQWHLTLAFYGEVPPATGQELAERLARAAGRTPAMHLQLAGAGTFPRHAGAARVLWAGVAGDVAALVRLGERCVAAGRRCGVTMEDRPLRPHLTLARARREPVDATEHVARLAPYDGPTWPVTALRLVHSTLGARVRHETIGEWPIGIHQA